MDKYYKISLFMPVAVLLKLYQIAKARSTKRSVVLFQLIEEEHSRMRAEQDRG